MTSTINKVQRRLRSQAHTERVCNFTAIPYDLAMANRRASFYADLDLLRSQFDSLDPQNTGYIGYSELTTLVKSMQGFEESMVPDLMDRLDRDKDGKVSFEDFEALFALERETTKKEVKRRRPLPTTAELDISRSLQYAADLSHSLRYDTALDTLPSDTVTSPTSIPDTSRERGSPRGAVESPTVILRHKRVGRTSAPAQIGNMGFLSPIHSGTTPTGRSHPPYGKITDLETQMHHYLTGSGDVTDSPQLNRNSRVLSWISESEDMLFEDTGSGTEQAGAGMPSPPMSPLRSSDEASHVKSILESVCHSEEIGREAIGRLCSHVKADPQEEQELLSLLEHLDKRKRGHVTLDEFVKGLQAVRNAAAVVTSTPSIHRIIRRRHSDQPIPILSEPFTTPISSKQAGVPQASTPLPPAARADVSAVLSVLDPDNSGYVKVDALVTQWQEMGVENPTDCSLQEALTEVVPVDAAGRVSVLELTASLEGAILSEGKTQAALRHAAVRSFKSEIVALQNQVHQVSLERDKLRMNLSRTLEENKQLVREGDEHVDLVTQRTEDQIRKQMALHTEKLREVERSRQEDAQLMQDRASQHISRMEVEVTAVKAEEERLRSDLRSTQEQVQQMTERLSLANQNLKKKERTIEMLQRDLGIRSELAFSDDIESQLSRISELENEVSERTTQNQELLESTRELKDRIDLLLAENEQWKQKYISQRRHSQRRRSSGSKPQQNPLKSRRHRRHSSGSKPIQKMRGLGEEDTVFPPPRLNFDTPDGPVGVEQPQGEFSPPNSPLSPPNSPLSPQEFEVQEVEVLYHSGENSTEESSASSDELITRSSASLLDEFQHTEHATSLQKRIDQLWQEKAALEASCQQLEQQLRGMGSSRLVGKDELFQELEKKQRQQAELEKLIQRLEKQRKKLSATKMEIDTQFAITDESLAQQLEEIQGLKRQLTVDTADLKTQEAQLEQLTGSLRKAETELRELRTMHEETVTRLAEEIQKLEDEKEVCLHQSQQLEQSKVQLSDELSSLHTKLESEKELHAEEVSNLAQKLREAQELISEVEAERSKSISEVRKELESAQASVVQYMQAAENLTGRLQETHKVLDAKEHQLAEAQKQLEAAHAGDESAVHAEEVARLRLSLEQMQDEYSKSSELNEHLQNQVEMFETTAVASKQKAEDEVSKLQSQLIAAHNEMSDQSTLYEDEILQLKEDFERDSQRRREKTEMRLAEINEGCQRQIQRYRVQLEVVEQELKSCEMQEKRLQGKLVEVEQEYENTLAELTQLRESEESSQLLIADYQANEEKYLAEISQCRQDAQNYQAELILLRARDGRTQDELSSSMDPQATPVEENIVAVEVVDGLEAFPDLQSPNRSMRSSYYSEQSTHDDIVDQMKSQLEGLQKVLILQGKRSGEDGVETELSLVQELLANNAALQSELQKTQHTFDAECSRHMDSLIAKDGELEELQSRIKKEREAAETLAAAATNKLLSELDTLHDHFNKSIIDYNSRVENAVSKVAAITATLTDRDQRHSSAIDSLLSDLDESRSALDSYRYEVDLLKSGLDKSQEDLNRSHTEIAELQQDREKEVGNLRDRLKRAESFHKEKETRDTDTQSVEMELPPCSPTFDASIQTDGVASTQFEFPTMREPVQAAGNVDELSSVQPTEALSKDRELLALREELERTKSLEMEARGAREIREREIQEKEHQLREKENEIQIRDIQIQELEWKLDSVVKEPVEAVIQYIDSAPLESVSDAMLVEIQREAEVERGRERERGMQLEEEVVKLKEDLNTSLTDSAQQAEEMSALRVDLSNAEERERGSHEAQEALSKEHEQQVQELEEKHSRELSAVKAVIESHHQELQELHTFLVGPEQGDRRQLDHSGLVREMKREIVKLKSQLSQEKNVSHNLKETMSSKIADFEQQEMQFHAEHEEEVMALYQQKQQLLRQREEMHGHYQQLLGEQDQQTSILLQDLVNRKADLEDQLQEKVEQNYQQDADHREEKRVLLHIVQQLCFEAGKPIDIV